jgi:undecaprenyl-diphosphatase
MGLRASHGIARSATGATSASVRPQRWAGGPPPAYRGAIAVGILAAAVFACVAVHVVTGASTAVDNAILATLHANASGNAIAIALAISLLGSEGIVLLLPLAALVLWLRKLRWQLVEVVVATLGADVLNNVLKLVFHRARPPGISIATDIPGQGYSFPSGHALVSIAFYGALAYVGWRLMPSGWRDTWIALMGLIVVSIAVSRLALGVHYPTDLLASWAAGLIWLEVTLFGVGYIHQRRTRDHQSIEAAPARSP